GSECCDPAARDTVKSDKGGPDWRDANAVICDPAAFRWEHDGDWAWRRRAFDQHIIYQAHWGTFLRPEGVGYDYQRLRVGPDEAERRRALRDKLAYIADLGFTCLELLPMEEANGNADGGYDPSFFWAIESTYGGPDDLRVLVDEAHALGLA